MGNRFTGIKWTKGNCDYEVMQEYEIPNLKHFEQQHYSSFEVHCMEFKYDEKRYLEHTHTEYCKTFYYLQVQKTDRDILIFKKYNDEELAAFPTPYLPENKDCYKIEQLNIITNASECLQFEAQHVSLLNTDIKLQTAIDDYIR